MNKISVVIPVYNVEKYLKQCVESVLNQTYREFELILVDDGSTDNCAKMCDEIKQNDNRVKVVHKTNGGLSSARNAGIDVAKGELITFIDSDDLVSPIYLEQLLGVYKRTVCDVVVGNIATELTNLSSVISNKNKIISKELALKYLLKEKISTSACGKLFVKSLFDNIRFPEGKIYEDYATIPKIFGLAKQIATVDNALYYYRSNDCSITGVSFNAKRMQYFEIAQDILDYLKENFPKFQKLAFLRNTRYAISFYRQVAKSNYNDEQIEKFLTSYIRKNILRYLFATKYSILSKFYGLCVALNFKFVKRF